MGDIISCRPGDTNLSDATGVTARLTCLLKFTVSPTFVHFGTFSKIGREGRWEI